MILISAVQHFTNDILWILLQNDGSLTKNLQSDCKVAIKWSHENKMIANHDKKFRAILIDQQKSNNANVKLVIASE